MLFCTGSEAAGAKLPAGKSSNRDPELNVAKVRFVAKAKRQQQRKELAACPRK
ncbi:hypothetical protein [Lysinibacillus sp. 54212]|uniref:hypothetical protein n=1 Tax=Lysinibacillus sp. 54212 TaxID=3119829 RepID=UPI002FCA3C92